MGLGYFSKLMDKRPLFPLHFCICSSVGKKNEGGSLMNNMRRPYYGGRIGRRPFGFGFGGPFLGGVVGGLLGSALLYPRPYYYPPVYYPYGYSPYGPYGNYY
jgi:hypothetical protein